MKWIGLTGGIACGKSSVARLLRSQGLTVVDADEVAHQALSPGESSFEQVVHLFGPGILNQEGTIDRKVLGEIVFADKSKLAMLEGIVHPWVRARVSDLREGLRKKGESLAFYDVPLLFEKRMEDQFNAIVVVACDQNIQLQRLKKRNGFTEAEAQLRLAAQMPLTEKISRASLVVWNNGDLTELAEATQNMLGALKKIL